ncbi:MAG: SRPBCC family protein [Actinomycetota bacterium]|nr:SRPBCC family protein [Actinomycetota bacterium]
MRYEDGPTVEVEVAVDASPEKVWEAVCDISVPARFSAELIEAAWVGGATGPALGARFVGRNQHPAIGRWETTSVIAEYDPPRRLAWNVENDGAVSASWRFEVLAEGDGTRLRQWGRMGPAPSGLTPAIAARPDKEERIVAGRMDEWRRNMTATVEGIKALVESGGAAGTRASAGRWPAAPHRRRGPCPPSRP